MIDIVNIQYQQKETSTDLNKLGMREMQARAFEKKNEQYLLVKAPPASGKSRALMFLALDKLENQGIKKAIVCVPQKMIGSSFKTTDLQSGGFFCDWTIEDKYNLCTPGAANSRSKVKNFHDFLQNKESKILICTHSTFRFACESLKKDIFDNTLLAIDEFHHVSSEEGNVMGELLKKIISESSAHIVAMTGSYFRGDSVPVLTIEDESKFEKVIYNYYEQLNGYKYLKSLGLGFHFYQGKYTSAIMEVLDTNKKTIIHIPHPMSNESTKKKDDEVGFILDSIGDVEKQDPETGVIYVRRKDGKILKIADLVEAELGNIKKISTYLEKMKSVDDIDIIIALNRAQEGFDWPWCEHALTVSYRGSLTQIVQIIGRCTRDSSNKSHAQFTNLIAQPDAKDDLVTYSVNSFLKAVAASLLMESVLAPVWKFKPKMPDDDETPKPGEIKIKGIKKLSPEAEKIIDTQLNDIQALINQNPEVQKSVNGSIDPKVINKVIIPKILKEALPNQSEEVRDQIREQIVCHRNLTDKKIQGDQRLIKFAKKLDVDDIDIDLIDTINPFQEAFEILSKKIDPTVLNTIQETIYSSSSPDISMEEAKILWPKIKEFIKIHKKNPNINSLNPEEKRLAQCFAYLKRENRKYSQTINEK